MTGIHTQLSNLAPHKHTHTTFDSLAVHAFTPFLFSVRAEGDIEVRVAPSFRRGWKAMLPATVEYAQHALAAALAQTLPQVLHSSAHQALGS